MYSASDRPCLFLRVISLNLQKYLCLCVVSGHTPSQRALQEWPVLCLSPSVAAVVLCVMFDKRLKFQKNGLQICWKPGSVCKGRRELRPEACNSSKMTSNTHCFFLSVLHHSFYLFILLGSVLSTAHSPKLCSLVVVLLLSTFQQTPSKDFQTRINHFRPQYKQNFFLPNQTEQIMCWNLHWKNQGPCKFSEL